MLLIMWQKSHWRDYIRTFALEERQPDTKHKTFTVVQEHRMSQNPVMKLIRTPAPQIGWLWSWTYMVTCTPNMCDWFDPPVSQRWSPCWFLDKLDSEVRVPDVHSHRNLSLSRSPFRLFSSELEEWNPRTTEGELRNQPLLIRNLDRKKAGSFAAGVVWRDGHLWASLPWS